MNLFDRTTFLCSKIVTTHYSTSFTLGIKTLDKKFHAPIYAIYGFVRIADEIVDTFHNHDKKQLLENFRRDTYVAIEQGLSINPILHSFQYVVRKYNIPHNLIEAFLKSMEMDLHKTIYDKKQYETYIFGSAEVVGLMCLCVFCEGDANLYHKLEAPAKSLGSAFQKVNFLRDMGGDYSERGRVYFPGVNFNSFNSDIKSAIERDIQHDFNNAYIGIVQLPKEARLGVYLAYVYYLKLFKKIRLIQRRIFLLKELEFLIT